MKGRSKKASGGENDAEMDLKSKPMRYTADSNVNKEAEERKDGGRTKRKRGGECHKVEGEGTKMRMDRKPRKSGGRTGSDSNPFSSARNGTPPKGHTTESGAGLDN